MLPGREEIDQFCLFLVWANSELVDSEKCNRLWPDLYVPTEPSYEAVFGKLHKVCDAYHKSPPGQIIDFFRNADQERKRILATLSCHYFSKPRILTQYFLVLDQLWKLFSNPAMTHEPTYSQFSFIVFYLKKTQKDKDKMVFKATQITMEECQERVPFEWS